MSVTTTDMTIDTHLDGPHSGTEKMEVWVRDAFVYLDWTRKDNNTVGGVADYTRTIHDLPPGVPVDVALRLTRSGAAQVGSTSADPMDWPAGHRQMGVLMLIDNLVDDGSFVGEGLGAPGSRVFWGGFVRTVSDNQEPWMFYEFEIDRGAGFVPFLGAVIDGVPSNRIPADSAGYVAMTTDDVLVTPAFDLGDYGTAPDLRVRRATDFQVSDWLVFNDLAVPA